jgi:CelD/BcsL family acetyltransferase involved in cellulose biosynthesis
MTQTTLTVHSAAGAFAELAAEWRALLPQTDFDTLFYTSEWQQLTWDEFGAGALQLAAIRAADGALIGLAPFALHDGVIGFACYKEISDYLDVLVSRGHEQACYAAIVGWLTGPDAPAWRMLNLTNIRETSSTFAGFADALRAAGCAVETPVEDVCPVIALPPSFDGYLELLDGKERRELQRKLRRAQEESCVVFATDRAALAQDTTDFVALMKASMVTKNDFMTSKMEAFFQKLTATMADAGWLQLSFLEVGDEEPRTRAAAYLNFVYRDAVLVYNSGLDPAKFAHISPGQVLIARLIEHAIGEKRSAFDFLQGNESYKYKLGGKDVTLRSLIATRASV